MEGPNHDYVYIYIFTILFVAYSIFDTTIDFVTLENVFFLIRFIIAAICCSIHQIWKL